MVPDECYSRIGFCCLWLVGKHGRGLECASNGGLALELFWGCLLRLGAEDCSEGRTEEARYGRGAKGRHCEDY